MEQWRGRVALVVGAGGGIGASVAVELTRHAIVVIGCDRSMDRLQSVKPSLPSAAQYHAYQCDVTQPEEVEAMFAWIRAQHGGADILVNVAGVARLGSILTGDAAGWRMMMEINVIAVAKCCQEVYKCMKSRGIDDGYIINVNSILGHLIKSNSPDMSMYSASKFAVTALCTALRYELRQAGSSIRITSVSPGLVDTLLIPSMYGSTKSMADKIPYKLLSTDDVSRMIIHALGSPSHVQIDELMFRSTQHAAP